MVYAALCTNPLTLSGKHLDGLVARRTIAVLTGHHRVFALSDA